METGGKGIFYDFAPKKDSLVGGKRCWIVSSMTVFIFSEGRFWIFFWITTLKTVQISCGGNEVEL